MTIHYFAPECYGETTLYNSNMVLYLSELYSAWQSATENDRKQHTHRLRKTPDADSRGTRSLLAAIIHLQTYSKSRDIYHPENWRIAFQLQYCRSGQIQPRVCSIISVCFTISGMHKGKNKLTISQSGSGRATIHLFAEYIQWGHLSFNSYEKDELASKPLASG